MDRDNDYDGPDFHILESSRPKARKTYECEICEGAILIGTRYVKIVALEDSKFKIFRHHVACSIGRYPPDA